MIAYFTYEDIISKNARMYISENYERVNYKITQTMLTMLCYNILNRATNDMVRTTGESGFTICNTGYNDIVKNLIFIYGAEAVDFNIKVCAELNHSSFVLNNKLLNKLDICGILGKKCIITALNIKNSVAFKITEVT